MQLGFEPSPEGFAVDTSSFMAINENYEGTEREAVWQRVLALINAGRVKSVRLVVEELKRNDPDAYQRLASVRRKLVVPDTEVLTAAGRIARQFPRISRPLSLHEKADPWVIALGATRALTVVTQEADRPNRIPGACKVLEISCIRLDEMLARAVGPA